MKKSLTFCKAFSNYPAEYHACMVDEDGDIKVYDDIAGHYTYCHDLSAEDCEKIRKEAK